MKPLEVWTCPRAENLKKKSSKIPKNNYAAIMVSAAGPQIMGGGGGAPINKSRRRRRPQIVGGGGAAGARLYSGLQSMACTVRFSPSTCPIKRSLLHLMMFPISSCPVLFHTALFVILSPQEICIINSNNRTYDNNRSSLLII